MLTRLNMLNLFQVKYFFCGLFILFSCNCIGISNALSAQLTLYRLSDQEDEPIIISEADGVFPDEGAQIRCACVTGLWALYGEDDKPPFVIAGGEQDFCIEIKTKISKAILLSSLSGESNANTISVFENGMSVIRGKLAHFEFISNNEINKLYLKVTSPSFITVGDTPYTITTADKTSFCLVPNKTEGMIFYHCVFETLNILKGSLEIAPHCDESTAVVLSNRCVPYYKGGGMCERRTDSIDRRNIVKRAADSNSIKLGRVFLSGSVQMKNYTFVNDTLLYVEDYSNAKKSHNNTSKPIKSELYNYLLPASEKILGLRDNRPPKSYKSSSFRFLEQCKKIAQAACPKFYAGDDYYDVMIGTFINLQSREFKFEEPFLDFPTDRRITEALNNCLLNMTTYPFLRLDASNTTYNETATDCWADPPPGFYRVHGQTDELNVLLNVSSYSYEPVIDTSWQVVVLAHSACFNHFVNVNDHHRFLSVLMPLFTNGVNEFWWRGDNTINDDMKDIYGFAIGSLGQAAGYVTYCTAYSRLESAYPWDLPRPEGKPKTV